MPNINDLDIVLNKINKFNYKIIIENKSLDYNPLSLACKSDNLEIVDKILKSIENINDLFYFKDSNDNNIFHMLVLYDFKCNILYYIIKYLINHDKIKILNDLLYQK